MRTIRVARRGRRRASQAFAVGLALLTLGAGAASSGEVFVERVRCPLGGPPVEAVFSTACTTFGRVSMSMRRHSSCDFVSRILVCARQDFPVYRLFERAEIARLRQIVKTDWYQAARAASPFLRAYLVEREFGTLSAQRMFWLLQEGYFHDPDASFGDPDYFAAYRDAANAYLQTAGPEDRKAILLMAAYARIHTDAPEKARTLLAAAARIKTPQLPFLDVYSRAVAACIGRADAPACAPEALVPQ